MSFMDRARERAYASGLAGPSTDTRLVELEREVAALRGEVTRLQGSMRGLDGWLADQPKSFTLADVVNAVMVATGGRASEAVAEEPLKCPDAADCDADCVAVNEVAPTDRVRPTVPPDVMGGGTEWKSPEWIKDEQRSWE